MYYYAENHTEHKYIRVSIYFQRDHTQNSAFTYRLLHVSVVFDHRQLYVLATYMETNTEMESNKKKMKFVK